MRCIVMGYGNVGKLIAAELKQAGDTVVLGRQATADTVDGLEAIKVDLLDPASLDQSISGCDMVFVTTGLPYKLSVWRAQWPKIIDNLIAAAVKHKAKLVFIDNIYLYGPSPLQAPITETHPRQPTSQKGQVRLGLVSKLEAAMKDGLDVLIVRCADFYGPNVATSGLTMAVEAALKGKTAYVFGDQASRHSFSYVPDIAKATVLLAKTSDCFNQTWHAPTPPGISGLEIQKLIESALGKQVKWNAMRPNAMRILRLFVPILRELREMMYQYENDYLFDSSKFETRFPDFVVTPYADGVQATVAAARRL